MRQSPLNRSSDGLPDAILARFRPTDLALVLADHRRPEVPAFEFIGWLTVAVEPHRAKAGGGEGRGHHFELQATRARLACSEQSGQVGQVLGSAWNTPAGFCGLIASAGISWPTSR